MLNARNGTSLSDFILVLFSFVALAPGDDSTSPSADGD
jgi:hypothetical protein